AIRSTSAVDVRVQPRPRVEGRRPVLEDEVQVRSRARAGVADPADDLATGDVVADVEVHRSALHVAVAAGDDVAVDVVLDEDVHTESAALLGLDDDAVGDRCDRVAGTGSP